MNVIPKCRVCRTRVDYFGAYCSDCKEYEGHEPDGLDEIVSNDLYAIQDRMVATSE